MLDGHPVRCMQWPVRCVQWDCVLCAGMHAIHANFWMKLSKASFRQKANQTR